MFKSLNWLLDWLAPLACLGCRQPDTLLCLDCKQSLKVEKLTAGLPGLDHCLIACHYSQPLIRQLVKQFKYNNLQQLAETLGRLLAQRLQLETKLPNFVIVPVPLHRRRQRRRGYNQSELLAQELTKKFNWPLSADLKRVIAAPPQAKLKRKKRLTNLQGAFAYSGPALEQPVLLIDDVTTTGQTLIQAAAVLKANGAPAVWALTLAKNI